MKAIKLGFTVSQLTVASTGPLVDKVQSFGNSPIQGPYISNKYIDKRIMTLENK